MQIAHGDDAQNPLTDSYRGGGKDFCELLLGDEAAPDNYRVVLARVIGDVYTPRHKHIFDQIRLCISGEINFGKGRDIRAGEIGYFPEGTPYGPEVCKQSDRLGITIQFGGAGGSGFPSERQMQIGRQALAKEGRFADGIFKRDGKLAAGQKRNQDAHEAVLEYISGAAISYPEMRYDAPVLIRPQGFQWTPLEGQAGAAAKKLGRFTERSVEIDEVRIEAGAGYDIPVRGGIRLGVVLDCTGAIDGQGIRPLTAFEIGAGEAAAVTADTALEIFLLGLPIFD